MSDKNLNPMGRLYESFIMILDNLTIKYTSKAEEYETKDSKMSADRYLDCLKEKDNFYTYLDWNKKEMIDVGFLREDLQDRVMEGELDLIPPALQEDMLKNRRKKIIDEFEEQNNYYRMLNGYPDLDDKDVIYISHDFTENYGIDDKIPLYKIQDYYNKKTAGLGDYYISVIEGSGFVDRMIEVHPNKNYLKYIGSNRIDLYLSRKAKNFQIIQLKQKKLRQSVYDTFLQIYEQCREYFVKTIYVPEFSKIIDDYDNYIAMSIFVMTTCQIIMRQIPLSIRREFFDIYAVKALYEAYNIPYNLNIDEETQKDIMQNLNLLIQNKSTDKVIYDIASLLGFPNIKVYKYYLAKEHNFDSYGVPVFEKTTKFNTDTGENEVVYNDDTMYDVYFQKEELKNNDFIMSFNDPSNRSDYYPTIEDDPFWWEDQLTRDKIYNTAYNFVESKYLSLGISYSLTDMMFENIMLLQMILNKGDTELSDVMLTLPRITGNTPISLFDVIVLLICLTSAKHNINGEVISIPTQVIHVLDYMRNVEQTDMLVDTFSFDFNYFSPDYQEEVPPENINKELREIQDTIKTTTDEALRQSELARLKRRLGDFFIVVLNDDNSTTVYEKKGQRNIFMLKKVLGEEEYQKFLGYISILDFKNYHTPQEKIDAFNNMYSNVKSLYKFLSFQMTLCDERKDYEILRQMFDAAFYAKEMRSVFTITGEISGTQRTAWNFFEFLFHKNRGLYNAIFSYNEEEEYQKYLKETGYKPSQMSLEDFLIQVEYGNYKIDYSKIIGEVEGDENVKNEKIYAYIMHIISRLEAYIKDLHYIYLLADTASPLEELLVKLVRFFKSYTVDMLNLDTLLVCDMKEQNLMKLWDIVWHIDKTIVPKDYMNWSYSDVIHLITSVLNVDEDTLINDKFIYDKYLIIKNQKGYENNVKLTDDVEYHKDLDYESNISMFDLVHQTSVTEESNDSCKVRDGIYKLWYE